MDDMLGDDDADMTDDEEEGEYEEDEGPEDRKLLEMIEQIATVRKNKTVMYIKEMASISLKKMHPNSCAQVYNSRTRKFPFASSEKPSFEENIDGVEMWKQKGNMFLLSWMCLDEMVFRSETASYDIMAMNDAGRIMKYKQTGWKEVPQRNKVFRKYRIPPVVEMVPGRRNNFIISLLDPPTAVYNLEEDEMDTYDRMRALLKLQLDSGSMEAVIHRLVELTRPHYKWCKSQRQLSIPEARDIDHAFATIGYEPIIDTTTVPGYEADTAAMVAEHILWIAKNSRSNMKKKLFKSIINKAYFRDGQLLMGAVGHGNGIGEMAIRSLRGENLLLEIETQMGNYFNLQGGNKLITQEDGQLKWSLPEDMETGIFTYGTERILIRHQLGRIYSMVVDSEKPKEQCMGAIYRLITFVGGVQGLFTAGLGYKTKKDVLYALQNERLRINMVSATNDRSNLQNLMDIVYMGNIQAVAPQKSVCQLNDKLDLVDRKGRHMFLNPDRQDMQRMSELIDLDMFETEFERYLYALKELVDRLSWEVLKKVIGTSFESFPKLTELVEYLKADPESMAALSYMTRNYWTPAFAVLGIGAVTTEPKRPEEPFEFKIGDVLFVLQPVGVGLMSADGNVKVTNLNMGAEVTIRKRDGNSISIKLGTKLPRKRQSFSNIPHEPKRPKYMMPSTSKQHF